MQGVEVNAGAETAISDIWLRLAHIESSENISESQPSGTPCLIIHLVAHKNCLRIFTIFYKNCQLFFVKQLRPSFCMSDKNYLLIENSD